MPMQSRLASNINSESEAYGYTLSIWGGGAILINQFGSPTILQIYLFIGGALLGFGVLSVIAFDDLFTPTEPPNNQKLIVASTIHIFGTVGNLLLSYAIAVGINAMGFPSVIGFFLVGLHVTITYNLGLVTETWVANIFNRFEQWHEPSG